MPGLTIGYGAGDVENVTNTKSEESTLFAKYAFEGMGLTVGIQKSEKDLETGVDTESTGIGISHSVNDDLTISYGTILLRRLDQMTKNSSNWYFIHNGIIRYCIVNEHNNIANSATNDEVYQLGLSFAF